MTNKSSDANVRLQDLISHWILIKGVRLIKSFVDAGSCNRKIYICHEFFIPGFHDLRDVMVTHIDIIGYGQIGGWTMNEKREIGGKSRKLSNNYHWLGTWIKHIARYMDATYIIYNSHKHFARYTAFARGYFKRYEETMMCIFCLDNAGDLSMKIRIEIWTDEMMWNDEVLDIL